MIDLQSPPRTPAAGSQGARYAASCERSSRHAVLSWLRRVREREAAAAAEAVPTDDLVAALLAFASEGNGRDRSPAASSHAPAKRAQDGSRWSYLKRVSHEQNVIQVRSGAN